MENEILQEEEHNTEELADVSELIALLEKRSATYALLSRLYFKEVDQELLDELHGMLYPVETGDSSMDLGNLYIATYLSNLWSESLTELSIDYNHCFFGNGIDSYSAAYLFESVYTSEKRLLMEKARQEVLAIYCANGIQKTEKWHEGEDHLSLEMEFERIICGRAIEALQNNDEEKARQLILTMYQFLKDHLINWVPMMTSDLKQFAKTKFYLGLAHLTDGFLRTDRQFLKGLLFDDDNPEEDEEE